jgi:proteasome assembly chaperone (PAC2) family protein
MIHIWAIFLQHLMCDVWIWQDLVSKFAKEVFEINQLNEEELQGIILGGDASSSSD